MNLNEYIWSGNPRGMHSALNFLDLDQLSRNQIGWAKIVALGDGEADLAAATIDRGMTPIVRIFRERPGNAPVDGLALQQFQTFRQAGVRWFEYYNEPNLDAEWPRGADWNPNNPSVVGPLMDNWLSWAEFIISIGGYPGFPAFADVNDGTNLDTITWIRRTMEYLADNQRDRFRNVLNNGAYIAVHPYIANHYYQELPGGGPTSIRPAGTERADEGGWHFEYPYDPINQADDPGVTVWGGTARAPYGDTVGLLGSATALMEQLQTLFDVQAIPMVGTEGGISIPRRNATVRPDTRYPAVTWDSHAEATLAMFDWISSTAPPWFFGVALWKFDEYYQGPEGPLRVAERFSERPPRYKIVPPLPVLNSEEVVAVYVPPIYTNPDHHFVFLAPGFDAQWLFEHGTAYWDAFQPALLSNLDFVDLIDSEKTVAITAISPPDMVNWLSANIAQRWPAVQLDTVVVQQSAELRQILNQRVVLGRRLG